MTSAWGLSWGKSWGAAWGAISSGNNQGGGGLYLYLKYKKRLKFLAEAVEKKDEEKFVVELEKCNKLQETIKVTTAPVVKLTKFAEKSKDQNNIDYDRVFAQIQNEILKIDRAIQALSIKEKEDELAAELLILTAFA